MSSDIKMPWGKFRGWSIADIETTYLVWVLEHADHAPFDLLAAIRRELQFRFGAQPPPRSFASSRKGCPDPTLASQLIAAGLHVLARKHHPDVGGTTAQMQVLNAVADWLRLGVSR